MQSLRWKPGTLPEHRSQRLPQRVPQRLPQRLPQHARVGESLQFVQRSHSFSAGQQPGLLPFLTAFGCLGQRRATPGKSRHGYGAAASENVSPQAVPPQITSRIRLWRALVRGDTHTIGTLAEAAGISSKEAGHHLEHVMRQARTLKNKSAEWRMMREIPPEWDGSSVRVQVTPVTCDDCGWAAEFVSRRMSIIRRCKRCGSRHVSPVLVQLVYSTRAGRVERMPMRTESQASAPESSQRSPEPRRQRDNEFRGRKPSARKLCEKRSLPPRRSSMR